MSPRIAVMDAKAKTNDIDVRENGTKYRQKPEVPSLSPLTLSGLRQSYTHNCMRDRRGHK